ncbi:hypothetical protein BYT27DRAFT_7139002 [Phlegmacium glaucopus]|nr:hypothetical protein BYT27DRAFT_7139002 [Phlegmacium glaucopus]
MLRSLDSPQDTHVVHLRNLIDQRSTRADIRGRFSAISEYSDTPSVYSRPFFSPKPLDNDEYQSDQDYPSPTSATRSHRDQLNDNTPSMLDLDDPRSSFATSETFNIDDAGYEDGDSSSTARMSYLGPKMRFHSRAPWELDDDTLEEEAEPEGDHRSFQSVFPFRGNGAKSATSSSSSPRPSYTASRPSGESSRSQVPPKRSFETINSQISYPRGVLYTLAQESVSSYSLGRSTPPAQKETLRSKFSLGRLRSEPSNVDLSPSCNPSPGRSPLTGRFPPSPGDNDPFAASIEVPMRITASHTAKGNSVKIEDNVHPYANPDLVASCVVDRPRSPFRATSNCQQRAHDEANTTLSESCITDPVSRRPTFIPDTTVNSALPKHRMSSIQAKNISSPVSVIGAPIRIETPLADNHLEQNPSSISPGINSLSSWTDPNVVPAFSLISLEEARAQRMRSATANPTSMISTPGGMSNPFVMSPPIETEAVPGADPSHVGGSTTRTRARSISAGANKARNALQTIVSQPKPERRDSEPTITAPQPNGAGYPGKTLKHKKSGFMRLFNAGKVSEKDEIPPSVPSLPDSHSIHHIQPVVQRTPRSSIHRIPVPNPSPSLIESSSTQSSDTLTSDTWKQSTKRIPPTLSIDIQPPVVSTASASVIDNRQNRAQIPLPFTSNCPWPNDPPRRSAPANVSEFPALKLRPVSTLFSAHFGDHIVATESSEIDLARPRSSSSRQVTLTPVSAARASHEQLSTIPLPGDQASVVRSLQEEKKAWQLHIWELEGQVRDLKATVEDLKSSNNKDYCQNCGRGKKEMAVAAPHSTSVMQRPRARTGTSSRFTSALP